MHFRARFLVASIATIISSFCIASAAIVAPTLLDTGPQGAGMDTKATITKAPAASSVNTISHGDAKIVTTAPEVAATPIMKGNVYQLEGGFTWVAGTAISANYVLSALPDIATLMFPTVRPLPPPAQMIEPVRATATSNPPKFTMVLDTGDR